MAKLKNRHKHKGFRFSVMKGLTKIGTLLANSCFASFLACNADLVSSFLCGIMGLPNCFHLEVPMPS